MAYYQISQTITWVNDDPYQMQTQVKYNLTRWPWEIWMKF